MFPEDILTWFQSRGISEAMLRHFGIWWNGKQIVIPIKDETGKTIFNKFRRDPRTEEGPKYIYEKGNSISLYNYNPNKKDYLMCEGELDVIRLATEDIYAITSTSGASSFQEGWLESFKDKNLVVCFDNDDAGIKGMLKIGILRPETRFISFPEYWSGKDITDFLKNHTKQEFEKLIEHAYELPFPYDKNYTQAMGVANDVRRTLKRKRLSCVLISAFISYCVNEREKEERKKEKKNFDNDINSVKDIPITDFIDFNIANFGSCLWHKEKTPSMKYYPESNTIYCFGCNKYADVISVVRKLHNSTFVDTINFLKEKYAIKN